MRYAKYFFVLAFLFYSSSCVATQKKDSLAYYQKKLKIRHDLRLDSVIQFYTKAKTFSDFYITNQLNRAEAEYLYTHGVRNIAHKKYLNLLELASVNKLRVLEAVVYLDLSNYYYYYNDFNKSYKAILRSKAILEEVSDSDVESYSLLNNANYTRRDLIEIVLFNLGSNAAIVKEYEKATAYYQEALYFYTNNKDKQGVIDARINIAGLLYDQKRYKEGNKAFQEILAEYKLSNYDLAIVYYNLADNHFELHDFSNAYKYIDKAILLTSALKDDVQLMELYYDKSRYKKKQGVHDQERVLLHKSLQKSMNTKDFSFQVKIYKSLAECDIAQNNPKDANKHYQSIVSLRDSIHNKSDSAIYKELELENRLFIQEEKNKSQVDVIAYEKKRSRLLILVIVFGSLLFAAIIAVFVTLKKNSNKKMQLAIKNAEIKEFELENKRIVEAHETHIIQEDLKNKKRELMLSLLSSKDRKNKLSKIVKEFEKIECKSVISKMDVKVLKSYIINQSNDIDNNAEIQKKISNISKDFFTDLIDDYPSLSKTELKVFSYMRVGLETKEIAEALYVSVDAIRKTRHRIRKKIHLDPKESLEKFILRY